MYEIFHYITADGRNLFAEWFESLADSRAKARIASRLQRVAGGNLGDTKFLRDGISEFRIDVGPGYRLYYTRAGNTIILLLCGGDKRRQSIDIQTAAKCLVDYRERTK